MNAISTLPALLEAFFTDRLMRQRQASPHTIASYRDTFCLLLRFAQQRLQKPPSSLNVPELDTPLLGCDARARGARLVARRCARTLFSCCATGCASATACLASLFSQAREQPR